MSPADTGGNIVTPRSHGTNNWIENQVILASLGVASPVWRGPGVRAPSTSDGA